MMNVIVDRVGKYSYALDVGPGSEDAVLVCVIGDVELMSDVRTKLTTLHSDIKVENSCFSRLELKLYQKSL